MPSFGAFRTAQVGDRTYFEVWDGMFWSQHDSREEAEYYLEGLAAAMEEDRVLAEPEPVRSMAASGIIEPLVTRELQQIRRIGDPPGMVREVVPGRLSYPNANGDIYPQPNTPDAVLTGIEYPTLDRAQGRQIDQLGALVGVTRQNNFPDGIGRAIEPDEHYRERIMTRLQAALPAGAMPLDISMSADGNYINVSASVQVTQPIDYIKVDMELDGERNDTIDEESRWDQIANEMFIIEVPSGKDTKNE